MKLSEYIQAAITDVDAFAAMPKPLLIGILNSWQERAEGFEARNAQQHLEAALAPEKSKPVADHQNIWQLICAYMRNRFPYAGVSLYMEIKDLKRLVKGLEQADSNHIMQVLANQGIYQVEQEISFSTWETEGRVHGEWVKQYGRPFIFQRGQFTDTVAK